ncbi:hypothetical protein V8C86DRAFT_3088368 [Haematococcus lacustris]
MRGVIDRDKAPHAWFAAPRKQLQPAELVRRTTIRWDVPRQQLVDLLARKDLTAKVASGPVYSAGAGWRVYLNLNKGTKDEPGFTLRNWGQLVTYAECKGHALGAKLPYGSPIKHVIIKGDTLGAAWQLPHAAVQLWAGSNALTVDSENSVVELISLWMAGLEGWGCSWEQKQQLSCLVLRTTICWNVTRQQLVYPLATKELTTKATSDGQEHLAEVREPLRQREAVLLSVLLHGTLFGLMSGGCFLLLGWLCWRAYGQAFLDQAFLHHLSRQDHRGTEAFRGCYVVQLSAIDALPITDTSAAGLCTGKPGNAASSAALRVHRAVLGAHSEHFRTKVFGWADGESQRAAHLQPANAVAHFIKIGSLPAGLTAHHLDQTFDSQAECDAARLVVSCMYEEGLAKDVKDPLTLARVGGSSLAAGF